MRILSRKWIVAILIIIILGSLNPTYTNFKEFTGLSGKDAQALHKKYNFFICSVYENGLTSKRYLGLLKNFIDITPAVKKEPPKVIKDVLPAPMDSTTIITDTTQVINSTSPTMTDSEFKKRFKESLQK